MATITQAVQWIQAQLRGLEGVRKAYDNPPDKTAADLVALAYTPSGSVRVSTPAGARTDYHNVYIQLHIPLKDIERDYARLSPYIEKVAAVIVSDLTWGGTVETIAGQNQNIERTLGPSTWGDMPIMALRFIVPIKIVQI